VKKAPKTFYYGEGCAVCDGSGYQGRVGIREVLTLNDDLRKLIMNRATAQEIKAGAVKNGMTSMLQDGINKAAEGLTTIEEVLRIINE
jgi:type II secretory ATPase GspE/PulE/Tfp pilus assembly ATPase PilB-like protein